MLAWSASMPKQPQPTGIANSRDHVAWLEHWSTQLVKSISRAITEPPHMATPAWDLELEHAVRCARAAHGHAVKLSDAQVRKLMKGER